MLLLLLCVLRLVCGGGGGGGRCGQSYSFFFVIEALEHKLAILVITFTKSTGNIKSFTAAVDPFLCSNKKLQMLNMYTHHKIHLVFSHVIGLNLPVG